MLENVSAYLAKKTVLPTKDNIDVLTYGYELALSTLFTSILLLVIASLAGEIMAGVIFIISYVPIRVCAGGYHAKTFVGCNCFSAASFVILLLAYRFGEVYFSNFMWLCILFVSALIILYYAPCEHKNQPLTDEKRLKNRRQVKIRLPIEMIVILLLFWRDFSQVYVAILSLSLVAILLIIPSIMKGENNENIIKID